MVAAAQRRLRDFFPGLDVAWVVKMEPRIALEDIANVVRRLVAVRGEMSLSGVDVVQLLGVWPQVLLADNAGKLVGARVAALATALPDANVPGRETTSSLHCTQSKQLSITCFLVIGELFNLFLLFN
jgi:hypothetical protein